MPAGNFTFRTFKKDIWANKIQFGGSGISPWGEPNANYAFYLMLLGTDATAILDSAVNNVEDAASLSTFPTVGAINTYEFNGAGYPVGGMLIPNQTILTDDSNNFVGLDSTDILITSIGAGSGVGHTTISELLVFNRYGGSNDRPVARLSAGATITPTGGQLSIVVPAEGWVKIVGSPA